MCQIRHTASDIYIAGSADLLHACHGQRLEPQQDCIAECEFAVSARKATRALQMQHMQQHVLIIDSAAHTSHQILMSLLCGLC